jgi:hypothetical protein
MVLYQTANLRGIEERFKPLYDNHDKDRKTLLHLFKEGPNVVDEEVGRCVGSIKRDPKTPQKCVGPAYSFLPIPDTHILCYDTTGFPQISESGMSRNMEVDCVRPIRIFLASIPPSARCDFAAYCGKIERNILHKEGKSSK